MDLLMIRVLNVIVFFILLWHVRDDLNGVLTALIFEEGVLKQVHWLAIKAIALTCPRFIIEDHQWISPLVKGLLPLRFSWGAIWADINRSLSYLIWLLWFFFLGMCIFNDLFVLISSCLTWRLFSCLRLLVNESGRDHFDEIAVNRAQIHLQHISNVLSAQVTHMGLCRQKMFAALIAYPTVATFHDDGIRLRVKADAALLLRDAQAHFPDWLIPWLLTRLDHLLIRHLFWALLIHSVILALKASLVTSFCFRLNHLFGGFFSFFDGDINDWVLELEKVFILGIRSIFPEPRLLPEMGNFIDNPLRLLKKWHVPKVGFQIGLRFVLLVVRYLGLLKLVQHVPFDYALFFFLPALFEVSPC